MNELENVPARRPRQAGFTLIETLIAIVIIVFGLIGVTNLFMVAASSNTVANQGTAATAVASQVLERLKAVRFTDITPGGDIEADTGSTTDPCFGAAPANVANPSSLNNCDVDLQGVGRIHARWSVTAVSGNDQVLFVRVRAEARGTLGPGRTRVDFTTFRSCTSTTLGCPPQ